MKIVKVPVSDAHHAALQQQAQGRYNAVSAYLAPLVADVATGALQPRYAYAAPAEPPPAAPPLGLRERLLRIPRLSPASRAVLAHVAEQYEAAGGKCVVETNAELAQALRFSARAVSRAVGELEVAGWLSVRLYAQGANGRQLTPTSKLRGTYAA